LGALYPSKSGLMNKHIVKHISVSVGLSGHSVSFFSASVPVQVRTNTQNYRENHRVSFLVPRFPSKSRLIHKHIVKHIIIFEIVKHIVVSITGASHGIARHTLQTAARVLPILVPWQEKKHIISKLLKTFILQKSPQSPRRKRDPRVWERLPWILQPSYCPTFQ
jgi:hypothetical protein